MSFDRETLARAVARHGAVARVVVAETHGSVPRETGAEMLVWPGGQGGTIGGGALEWEAAAAARAALAAGRDALRRVPLGPALGQCCGGSVTLLTEVWDAERIARHDGPVVARSAPGAAAEMPFAVRRVLAAARTQGQAPGPALIDGWMVEPARPAARPLWIWGAGHVGRALVHTLAPLPDVRITWVDTNRARFPPDIPEAVAPLVAADPALAVARAPADAGHLVLTFSHALDLELCHRLLGHGFASCGLIGSATKWARFRSRLRQLGHSDAQIARIACPIGDPKLGKHPHAIAVGVAAGLLKSAARNGAARGETA